MFKRVFDGRTYGPLGFTIEDGPGVCFSFHQRELKIKTACVYRPYSAGSHSIVKYYLLERDLAECKYCRVPLTYKTATVDHYFPPEMWHKSEVDLCDSVINLVLCCQKCNFIKGKKSPFDWHVYDRNDNRLRIQVLKFVKRKSTHLRLMLQGTRTLRGKHKGIAMYRQMNNQELKTARYARFMDDL